LILLPSLVFSLCAILCNLLADDEKPALQTAEPKPAKELTAEEKAAPLEPLAKPR
jgi:hypothetical protein